MNVYTDAKGRTCIGTKCFHVRADGDDVVVHYNRSDSSCTKDVEKAVDKMFDLISKGGTARFQNRKD